MSNAISIEPAVFPPLTVHILYYGTASSPPQNCVFSWEDPDPHLIHGYLGTPHPTWQTASRSVQSFLQGATASFTDRPNERQTDRPCHTSVAIGRIYTMHTMRPKKQTCIDNEIFHNIQRTKKLKLDLVTLYHLWPGNNTGLFSKKYRISKETSKENNTKVN